MNPPCTVCGRPADAYLCRTCSDELDAAFGDLPGLLEDVVTSVTRQARVHRGSGRRVEVDEDWRGTADAIGASPMPLDLDPRPLLAAVRVELLGWARHLAETRDVPLALTTGRATEGPVCAGHAHRPTVQACVDAPSGCRSRHPDHRHTKTRAGCPIDCAELHCGHGSCATIRRTELTGTAAALVRWFLRARDTIRMDEAAGDMHDAILDMRDQLRRAVDRVPSRVYAGPCHEVGDEVTTTVTDGTVYTVHRPEVRCDRPLYAWFNPWRTRSETRTITCDGWQPDGKGDGVGCGAEHPVTGRRVDFVIDSVTDALLPLAMWQAALPKMLDALVWPNRSTWWRWVAAGRLLPRSVDRSGVELFRGGDVVDLVRSEQKRIIGNGGKSGRISA